MANVSMEQGESVAAPLQHALAKNEVNANQENGEQLEVTVIEAPEESNDKDVKRSGFRAKRKFIGKVGFPVKQKKKQIRYHQPKNALMQLNELRPGLKYEFQPQQGPPHDPIFVVSVEVNDQVFIGKGNSKQLAKHAAAEAALASFVQFRNMPEAMCAMSKHITNADFTDDNVENEISMFNKFEPQKNGNDISGFDASIVLQHKLTNKLRKVVTEGDKKNPVMLLNELRPGLTYTLIRENTNIPSQRFVMSVDFDGEEFEGAGQNKKTAKVAAARCVLAKRYNISFNSYPLLSFPECKVDPELFDFPQSTADKIAKCVSETFSEVMLGNPECAKWKVLAGIAMTKDEAMEDVQIIGIGTGTKHVNGENMSMNGASLNDCHAEVISRRCLRDFFYTQLELHVEGEGYQSVFEKSVNGKFRLRPHHKFHLFISSSPCGDARTSSVHDDEVEVSDEKQNACGLLRTKIESDEGTIPVEIGQCVQKWKGILEGKCRYLTMSCSDKIASWNILGVQGSLLSHFLEPVYLDSIILGRLFHRSHIYRAICGRLENTLITLPSPYRLNKPKMCATTTLEARQLATSPDFSINWTTGLGRPEIIDEKTGKIESGQVSRLSKRSFFQRFSNIYNALSSKKRDAPHARLYTVVKNVVKDYHKAKEEMLKAFALAGLGNWVRKPMEQDEFELIF